jgi:hypothetical protein
MIAQRVELPVQDVIGRGYIKRIAQDFGSGMGCRAQLYDLGAERNGLVVPVLSSVMQPNLYPHLIH